MAKTKTGRTICSLEDLCFPVELIDNPMPTNQEYSKVVRGILDYQVPYHSDEELKSLIQGMSEEEAIEFLLQFPETKTETGEFDLNYCSPRYELVPNADIFPKVEDILSQHGIEFSVQYSHTNHARFYANYVIEDDNFSYKMKGRNGTNDIIKFVWNFEHSYNGLTKYKGIAGFYRLVCSNGMVIPIQEMKDYNLEIQGKHTSAILHSLEEFSHILTKVTDNLGEVKTAITDKYELLGGRWIANPQDRITEVLEANKVAIVENGKRNTLNDITNRIMSEANKTGLGYNGKVNDWLIYNGINQYLNDDNLNIAAPEKRRETDSKVLEYMLEYS